MREAWPIAHDFHRAGFARRFERWASAATAACTNDSSDTPSARQRAEISAKSETGKVNSTGTLFPEEALAFMGCLPN